MPNWKVWPSPPDRAHTFALELLVRDLADLPLDGVRDAGSSRAMVQLEWRGSGRRSALTRRGVERNCTARQRVRSDGTVSWWEGFRRDCKLKMIDSGSFKSWFVNLEIHGFGAIAEGSPSSPVIARTQLDVSKFASLGRERSIRLPVKCSIRGYTAEAELKVTLKFSHPHVKSGAGSTIMRTLSLRGSSCTAFPQIDSRPVRRPQTRAESGGVGGDSKSSDDQWTRSSAADSPSGEETELNDGNYLVAGKCEVGEDKKTETHPQQTHSFLHYGPSAPSLRRLLSWNRGKLGFKSFKYSKDSPPLYKASGDSGDGDVDNDPRAQPSVPSSLSSPRAQEHRMPEFEDEKAHVNIGSWEERTVVSRDGRLELVTEVFLASIDQRSEKASGESACSVLAAVIADWLHRNPALPLRGQFDDLVREGSAEWRRLCEDESRVERFSDRHFDLDTVLGAKVRPLAVVTELSYVGFFVLEAAPPGFEYLQGAMSFDNVWEELLCADAAVYITGWNDHFFVLKVEKEAVYLIDTLGERLSEGCNQAYILKFNRESRVYRTEQAEPVTPSASGSSDHVDEEGRSERDGSSTAGRRLVCQGLAAGKEFIKGFLAALPLRELKGDMERGLAGEVHLHRLLQIEFHYTSPL